MIIADMFGITNELAIAPTSPTAKNVSALRQNGCTAEPIAVTNVPGAITYFLDGERSASFDAMGVETAIVSTHAAK